MAPCLLPVLALVVLLAFVVEGFGGTVVSVALGSQLLSVDDVLTRFLPANLLLSLVMVVRTFQLIDRRVLFTRILSWMRLGMIAGGQIARVTSPNAVKVAFAAFVLALGNGTHKKNLFPISGLRASTLTDNCHVTEKPLLLNPFDVGPLEHLIFDDEGAIEPRGGSPQGAETIRTCSLHRDALQRDRYVHCVFVRELLNEYWLAGSSAERDVLLHRLRALGADDKPFAGMVRCVVSQRLGERTDALFGS